MAEEDFPVCVVTHPLSHASEAAIDGLLEVVAAAAGSASLITANLPDDSDIWGSYEVEEVNSSGMGESVPVAAFRFAWNQVKMCGAILRRDEEVFLFFGAVSYLLPILFARLLGKKVVVEPRGNVPASLHRIWSDRMPSSIAYLLSRPVWLLERLGFRLSHAILTLSPSMTHDLALQNYGAKLYEHGARPVDVERFQPTTPYEERPNRVGYLGRLDEEKGVDVLVDVVEHLNDEVEFVFIGDGALRTQIEDRLGDRIDSGSVEVTGWVDHEDVPEHLNSLRLLVMTSRTEGVPTTALEAMACGTPVAATPIGGIPDVVRDGETGYLLDSEAAPENWATRIEEVVEGEELERVSESCREFVVDNYSFEVVVERYRRVFEGLYD